jgi:hypothetical protein
MRALIVAEPWITLILEGRKTWEMRAKTVHHRGEIGLIRKGSKTVVGAAYLVDCLPSLPDLEAYSRSEPFHCIPPETQREAFTRGWVRPWVLRDARPLAAPIPYRHVSQVDWVKLPDL